MQPASTSSNQKLFQFKVELGTEIRRFTLGNADYALLLQTIREVFALPVTSKFSVKYKDPEGDLVIISSLLELQEALRICGDSIRLTIQPAAALPSATSVVVPPPVQGTGTNTSSAVSCPPACCLSTTTTAAYLPSTAPSKPSSSFAAPSRPLLSEDKKVELKQQKEKIKRRLQDLRKGAKTPEACNEIRALIADLVALKMMWKSAKEQIKEEKKFAKRGKKFEKFEKFEKNPDERSSSRAGVLARFVKDVSVPSGSEIPAGTKFVKTWRFRNDSSHAWPADSRLLFIGKKCDRLNAPDSVPILATVLPNQEVDVSVTLVAPHKPGHYKAFFRLADGNGKKFGQRVWLEIRVPSDSSSSSSYSFSSSSSSSSSDEAPASATDNCTAFAAQLKQLHDMKFVDDHKNVRLLKRFKGDVEKVVNTLLKGELKKGKAKHCSK